MSNLSDLGLDLVNLFQPAWARGKTDQRRFEHFTGEEGAERERRPGPRRDRREKGGARPGGKAARRGPEEGRKSGHQRRQPRRGQGGPREHREPEPLPEIGVTFLPDEKGVEQIARQIRLTGRSYPLFQIAQLILDKAERHSVELAVKKKGDGMAQPLFACALDETPWLSEDEAVSHVLKNHFNTFYAAERTPCDPPKGAYTFVAQCGMSGVILGPPNYHDYQNRLRKLHAERFSRMPFDAYKARVKIVKDDAIVKKWIEEQSFKTQYACLNVPEAQKLSSREEVEKHFRATHKDTIIRRVESHKISGAASRNLRSRDLHRLVRVEWDRQRHFPLQLATRLSREFAAHGLQFFKVNKTVVHVSVARPQFLDFETTPVSDNVRRIVEFINAHPRCTRRQLIEGLAPTPKPAVIEVKPDEAAVPAPDEPTPEQTALIADLHWLIHQGHVLEFADGRMETAKKPAPRPPQPPSEAQAPAEAQAPLEAQSAAEARPPTETETASGTQLPAEAQPAAEAQLEPDKGPEKEPENELASPS
ncbi:MAG: hypothetical protein KGR98_06550 [Verrucomicrobia bacterium]|nr:hypothetical protein [Verrucomicrobiota bacterium]MDE3099289.1 hypothetical protein [Verrucomicrobiota bacterium]